MEDCIIELMKGIGDCESCKISEGCLNFMNINLLSYCDMLDCIKEDIKVSMIKYSIK